MLIIITNKTKSNASGEVLKYALCRDADFCYLLDSLHSTRVLNGES